MLKLKRWEIQRGGGKTGKTVEISGFSGFSGCGPKPLLSFGTNRRVFGQVQDWPNPGQLGRGLANKYRNLVVLVVFGSQTVLLVPTESRDPGWVPLIPVNILD